MLTEKSKLCVDIVVAIASAPPGQPVSTHSLSTRLRVSISYLESVLRILREARLIQSIRGPGGGYCMAREADEVSVWDVVRRGLPDRIERRGQRFLDTATGRGVPPRLSGIPGVTHHR